MARDTAQTTDRVAAELDASAAPLFPCPTCGKESKEHHGGGRICSDRYCRHQFDMH